MNRLSRSQMWALVGLAAAGASIINLFLVPDGNLKIVIWVLIGLAVAAFAVITSQSGKAA